MNRRQQDISLNTLLIVVSSLILGLTLVLVYSGVPVHENSKDMWLWMNGLSLSYLMIYSLLKALSAVDS